MLVSWSKHTANVSNSFFKDDADLVALLALPMAEKRSLTILDIQELVSIITAASV